MICVTIGRSRHKMMLAEMREAARRGASARIGDKPPVRLQMWGPRSNVHLKIEDVRRAMFAEVPSAFLDLIDIAVYIYCADQAVPRANGGLIDGTKANPAIGQ